MVDENHIAVIGAGVSGLTLARELADRSYQVTLFDKARGPSGRCSTRRGEAGMDWDHGAQFFTARSGIFQKAVNEWMAKGVVMPWQMKLASISGQEVEWVEDDVNRYVGVPKMNSFCKHLAEGLEIITGSRIQKLSIAEAAAGGPSWMLTDEGGQHYGPFSKVVMAIPSVQAFDLVQPVSEHFEKALSKVTMRPTWAMMMSVNSSVITELPEYEAAYVNGGPISWCSRNSRKPGRQAAPEVENWVIHASHEWSEVHLELSQDEAKALLLDAWRELPQCKYVPLIDAKAHRWRFASPDQVLGKPCLWDADLGIGLCGDWCIAGRVEGAYLSGLALSRMMRGEKVGLSEFQPITHGGSAG